MPRRTSLSEFQSAIASAVMRPLASGEIMRHENRPVADAFIKPNDRLTASDRLQIYNQQYWWRLLGSFGEDFRGLRAVLGERRFDKLAAAYLHEIGSHSWNLRDLGSGLVGYLGANPALSEPFTKLAIEMASVEWARVVAFDGAQNTPLDGAKFARRKPGKMTLDLQPHLTLLELNHPVDRLLRRLKRSEQSSASNAVAANRPRRRIRLSADRLSEPIHLAVHRVDLSVYYKRLDPEAYHLLQHLRSGLPLGDACEAAFSKSTRTADEISEKVRLWFTAWTGFDWLCDRTRQSNHPS